MADKNLVHKGSLHKASELGKSLRLSDGIEQTPEKTHDLPEMTKGRGKNVMDVEEQTRHLVDETSTMRTRDFLDGMDKLLQTKPDTTSWLSNDLLGQHTLLTKSRMQEGILQKWCASCEANAAYCRCNNVVQSSASPSTLKPPCTGWLSMNPRGTIHQGIYSPELLSNRKTKTEPSSSKCVEAGNQMTEIMRGREHAGAYLDLNMESKFSFNASPTSTECTHRRDLPRHIDIENWQDDRLKAKVLAHPMFPKMLEAHIGCLRITTPMDEVQQIDEQLGRSHLVKQKYSVFAPLEAEDVREKDELDNFMVSSANANAADTWKLLSRIPVVAAYRLFFRCTLKKNYTDILLQMQKRLQHHVQIHAAEAMRGCREIADKLYALTGATPGPSTGARMSDDEEDEPTTESNVGYETRVGVREIGDFGPVLPTETERSLIDRVRQQLKQEFSEGYRNRIMEVRNEIIRKRRAGKLPGETTMVLKSWWEAHCKWPYPTEEEKELLVQETGLELQQVNNWFINQRKRNWTDSPFSSADEFKNKRKL